KQVQIRRRFMLLGQTLDGMCVWDVRRAVQALNHIAAIEGLPVELTAQGNMAGIALYASLFEPSVERLDLSELPSTHRDGPTFLNVLRYLDVPQAVAMAAERAPVVLHQADASPWVFPQSVANNLGWPDERFRVAAP
ncbi:MAG: acetylxylan esterase, partial [Planctomycetes bacterium]|nr:acetylxylan esterase [Planctomycetota bacterium]